MTNDAIRAKIEGLMGWKRGSSICFSFRALQTFVRGKDKKFDKELALYLDKGDHFYVSPKCEHGRLREECDICDEACEKVYQEALHQTGGDK